TGHCIASLARPGGLFFTKVARGFAPCTPSQDAVRRRPPPHARSPAPPAKTPGARRPPPPARSLAPPRTARCAPQRRRRREGCTTDGGAMRTLRRRRREGL